MDRPLPPPPPYPGRGHYPGDLTWLHGLFATLMLIALIVGAIVLVRMYLRRPRIPLGPPPRTQAMEELDLHYARGEIGRDAYLQRRADLAERPPYPGRQAAEAPAPPAGGSAEARP